MPNAGEIKPLSHWIEDGINIAERYKGLMNTTPKYIAMKYNRLDASKVILVVDRLLNCTKYHYDSNDYLTFIEGIVGERDFERMAMFFEESE